MLRVDLASLGVLKPLPYLVMFFMSNVGGWVGDALILRQKQSVAAARKAVNTIGASGMSKQSKCVHVNQRRHSLCRIAAFCRLGNSATV